MPKFQKIDVEKYVKPSKFIKWKIGDNRIRVLAEPYLYRVVGKRTANGFVRHILDESTPVPEFLKDAEPKLTYGFVVFSHDDGQFHVLETGTMLGHELTELIKSKYPEEYKAIDVIVNATGEKLKRKYACRFATDTQQLPKGMNRNSPEFKYIMSYFEEL